MNIAFLLEEPSAREMLKGLLPKMLPPRVLLHYLVFEGKQHLDANIERRLRGWRRPNTHFVIVRDQDTSDCKRLKDDIQAKCIRAGQHSGSLKRAAGNHWQRLSEGCRFPEHWTRTVS